MISTKHDNDDNDDDNSIRSMHVETAADTLLVASYGIHVLIIYSDLVKLREFWSLYTKKSIKEKNELVYLAPFYETVDSVRKALSEGDMSIDVYKYEKEKKSLIIKDSLEKHQYKDANVFDVKSILKANEELLEYANTLKMKGVSIIEDAGSFFFLKSKYKV